MTAPLLVAHRGWARRFPENTLEGLEAALEVGACFVEFDVQLTADGVPVLLHDADLRRTAGRSEQVLQIPLRQLLQISVGQPELFGDRFAAVRVPTLASAVQVMMRFPRARTFVEVKPESVGHFGVDRVLERVLADVAIAESRCTLVSYVGELLRRARQSGVRQIGFVLREWSESAQTEVAELQPDYVFCNLERIPPAIDLWSGPWQWVVYEVVDPAVALALAARGAGLVETMAIGEMLADPVLGERSCLD